MNFGEAFSYQFKETDCWKKLLIFALISLIPIIGGMVLIGWTMGIIKRMYDKEPMKFPELDFGGQLGIGFKVFVFVLVYCIPLIIFSIPSLIIQNVTSNEGWVDAMRWVITICCGGLQFVYSIIMVFALTAAQGNFVKKGYQLGAAFEFGYLIKSIKANPSAYLIAVLGQIVAGIIAPLGVILCGIGMAATSAYAETICAHFVAQAFQQAEEKMAAAPAA